MRRWRSSTPATATPFSSTIRSSARRPASRGRAALDDLDDLDAGLAAELAGESRRKGTRAAGDAEIGAAEPALAHERADDLPRRLVDRDGEPEADSCDGGVDSDHVAVSVRERSARVARVEGRVGLDHVLDDSAGRARAHRQRAAERGHHARGHRACEAVRVPDRDDELADAEVLRVPEHRRREAVSFGPQHGEVRERVRPDDLDADLAPSTKEARTPAVPLATTCAEVSMKPSGVTTTPLPPPSIRRPPRTRRETRRLATEGERRSATAMTAREYASRTSSSARGLQ